MQLPKRKPPKFTELSSDPLMSKEKYAELEKKLAQLKKSQPGAARDVARLAEMGDFSENVEYQIAKGRLRGINHRIFLIETQLAQAVLIKPKKAGQTVELGHTVTIESDNRKKVYQILGSSETVPEKGIISHLSPIGQALMGRKLGEKVKIQLGNKEVEYEIIKIT